MASGSSTVLLGELLIRRGLISQVQLEQALAHQRSTGEMLGAILIKMGAVTPEALAEAFAEHFGIVREPLEPGNVDWTVPDQFPASALSGSNCFPIRADERFVTVAIVNPLDVWGLSTIERAAGTRAIKLVLVLERELQVVLREYRRRTLSALEGRFSDHGDGKTQ